MTSEPAPNMSIKVRRKPRDMRIFGRIVRVRSTEQSVVIIKSIWQVERTINYEIRQIFKGVPLNQAPHRGK